VCVFPFAVLILFCFLTLASAQDVNELLEYIESSAEAVAGVGKRGLPPFANLGVAGTGQTGTSGERESRFFFFFFFLFVLFERISLSHSGTNSVTKQEPVLFVLYFAVN